MWYRIRSLFIGARQTRIEKLRANLMIALPPPSAKPETIAPKPQVISQNFFKRFSPRSQPQKEIPVPTQTPTKNTEPRSNLVETWTYHEALPPNIAATENVLRERAGMAFIAVIFCDSYVAKQMSFEDLVQRFRSGKIIFQDNSFVFYVFDPARRSFERQQDYSNLRDLLQSERSPRVVFRFH